MKIVKKVIDDRLAKYMELYEQTHKFCAYPVYFWTCNGKPIGSYFENINLAETFGKEFCLKQY